MEITFDTAIAALRRVARKNDELLNEKDELFEALKQANATIQVLLDCDTNSKFAAVLHKDAREVAKRCAKLISKHS